MATLNVKITLNVKKFDIKGCNLTLNVKNFDIKGCNLTLNVKTFDIKGCNLTPNVKFLTLRVGGEDNYFLTLRVIAIVMSPCMKSGVHAS